MNRALTCQDIIDGPYCIVIYLLIKWVYSNYKSTVWFHLKDIKASVSRFLVLTTSLQHFMNSHSSPIFQDLTVDVTTDCTILGLRLTSKVRRLLQRNLFFIGEIQRQIFKHSLYYLPAKCIETKIWNASRRNSRKWDYWPELTKTYKLALSKWHVMNTEGPRRKIRVNSKDIVFRFSVVLTLSECSLKFLFGIFLSFYLDGFRFLKIQGCLWITP